MAPRAASRWLQLQRLAIFLYLLFGALLIRQKVGLQYDEALHVVGTIHLRHLPHQELTLPHDPNTWIHVLGRWLPLMTVRYTGAIKEYFCLPLFAWFGPRTSLVRIVSLLFGAVGIWGIGRLIREQVGATAGAMVSLLIAVNPAYADMTVFDNNAVAIFMATLGLCCAALSRYLLRASTGAAVVLGVTLGFAIWARANFVWVVVAVLIAAILVLRKRILVEPAHWIVAGVGAILGGLPFLIYQVVSRGGTWEALGMFPGQDNLRDRLFSRLVMFSETLLSDREHRAIWDGPPMPAWERWLFPLIVMGACVLCLASRALWPRITALAFLLLAAILFSSRMAISEHHLVELLPFAAAMAVFGSAFLLDRFRISRPVVAALALLYTGCALYWQGAAIRGLRATGGIGVWSDALIPLAEQLEQKYPTRDINILDWGLQNNLYVVTDGRLQTREIFWDATRRSWIDELRAGGIFVLNGADHRQLPAASEGFLEAFKEGSPSAQRTIIPQRNGAPYAEIFDIVPNTLHSGPVSSVKTSDARHADQLEGFHQIEEGGWRWTKREFAVTLGSPESPSQLKLDLYIPETTIQKLGPMTISAQLNHHALKPETYTTTGSYTFTRDVPAAWLGPGPNRIEFSLNRAIEPSASDNRELGIIVSGAALVPDR